MISEGKEPRPAAGNGLGQPGERRIGTQAWKMPGHRPGGDVIRAGVHRTEAVQGRGG